MAKLFRLGKNYDVSYGDLPGMEYDEFPASGKQAPVVIFWHGGSWKNGRKESYRWIGRWLQSQGVNAVIADYPLFPQRKFPGFIEDANSLIEHVAVRYPGQPVFTMGHSAGAHIALIAAMTNQTAALAGCIAISAPCTINPGYYKAVFGDAFETGRQDPRSYAAETLKGRRFFIIHGQLDRIVNVQDSYNLHQDFIAAGLDSTLVINKFVGHLFILPALVFGLMPSTTKQLRRFLTAHPKRII